MRKGLPARHWTHLVVHAFDVVHRDLRKGVSERLKAVHGGQGRRGDVDVGDKLLGDGLKRAVDAVDGVSK